MSQLQLILLLNWFIEVGTYMVKTISIPDLAVTGIYNVAFHKRYPSGAKRQAYRLNAPDRLCGSRYCARNGYPGQVQIMVGVEHVITGNPRCRIVHGQAHHGGQCFYLFPPLSVHSNLS